MMVSHSVEILSPHHSPALHGGPPVTSPLLLQPLLPLGPRVLAQALNIGLNIWQPVQTKLFALFLDIGNILINSIWTVSKEDPIIDN